MKDDTCIFCKLANGDIPTSMIYTSEKIAVFLDAGPASKGHALILPKSHCKDITELPSDIAAEMIGFAAKLGKVMMEELSASGFNTLMNTGESAGQTVFHAHMHVIPRYDNGPSICSWTPGKLSEDDKKIAEKLAEKLK